MIAEIIGPSGRVHYRRPSGDPLVQEARQTLGYSVRIVCDDDGGYCYLPECAEHGCMHNGGQPPQHP